MNFCLRNLIRTIPVIICICDVAPVSGADLKSISTWTYDPQHPTAPCSPSPSCDIWRQFRAEHPYPYQAFAIRESDEEATIIVSEPPPSLSKEELAATLQAIFGTKIQDMSYFRWPVGVDGWLEDTVLRVHLDSTKKAAAISGQTLKPTEAPAEILDRLRVLHRLLYQTSEGFWLDESSSSGAILEPIQELKVSPNDLSDWLSADSLRWTSIASLGSSMLSSSADGADLFSAKSAGVFRNEQGLIALVVPKATPLTDVSRIFRVFAVSSDLLIGAAGPKSGGLVLIGRARQIPLSTLPPLRFESFAKFAKNRSESLAQSYERQRIFAGRIESGPFATWDWAPILLSPQLDDSEFGTLLNLADQILKSWSQHGQVDYYAFVQPKPVDYPFGDESASDYFERKFGTAGLVFNWNTNGFASLFPVTGGALLTIDRTNALPVLYKPFSESENDSEKSTQQDADARALDARDYFASKGNPTLVRVVQNVLLYQAIQKFLQVKDAPEQTHPARSDIASNVLEKEATVWLTESPDAIKSDKNDSDALSLAKDFMRGSGTTPKQFARIVASPQAVQSELLSAYNHVRVLEKSLKTLGEETENGALESESEFKKACAQVNGTLSKNTENYICTSSQSKSLMENIAFTTAHELEHSTEAKFTELKAEVSDYKMQRSRFEALAANYMVAVKVGEVISSQRGTADLDKILGKVLASTARIETMGPIRTPSVVLSRNSVDQEAIGGHSIDLVPRPTYLRKPLSFEIPIIDKPHPLPGEPKGQISHPRPPRNPNPKPVDAVLGKPRSGSLLDEMRPLATVAEQAPERLAAVVQKAKTCNCDALVVQHQDGSISFVRTEPPPVQYPVFGKSGIADALAGPPRPAVVRFENFQEDTVRNIAKTTTLLSDGPSGKAFDSSIDNLSGLFEPAALEDNSVSIFIEGRSNEPEVLRLLDEGGSPAAVNESVPWRRGQIDDNPDWASTFGADTVPDSSNAGGIIVRFGKGTGVDSGSLGVQLKLDPAKRQTMLLRLKTVVNRWLGLQPIQPKTLAQGVVELRAAIRTQLSVEDLKFFYARNGKKIRAAHLVRPEQQPERTKPS